MAVRREKKKKRKEKKRKEEKNLLVVLLSQNFAHDVHTEGARDADHAVGDLGPEINLLLVSGVVDVGGELAHLLLASVEGAWHAVESHTEGHCGNKWRKDAGEQLKNRKTKKEGEIVRVGPNGTPRGEQERKQPEKKKKKKRKRTQTPTTTRGHDTEQQGHEDRATKEAKRRETPEGRPRQKENEQEQRTRRTTSPGHPEEQHGQDTK